MQILWSRFNGQPCPFLSCVTQRSVQLTPMTCQDALTVTPVSEKYITRRKEASTYLLFVGFSPSKKIVTKSYA